MARLKEHYRKNVIPALQAKFGYQNVMQVPRITKITLNMGVGEAMADKKVIAVGTIPELLASLALTALDRGPDVPHVRGERAEKGCRP